jgi:hypothetical protein
MMPLKCRLFGHEWVPVLDEELQKVFGPGGYRCSRCHYGSGSKEAFMKYLKEVNEVAEAALSKVK